MDSERWQQVARVYEGAADRLPAERSAYLAQACAGDDPLRREVESLLDQEGTPVLIDRPALEAAGDLLAPEGTLASDTRLGPYQVRELIGTGGMGQVYRATDTRLNRTVAIKVLADSVALDPQARERFQREGRAVAALNHPHICTVHDVGQHPADASGPAVDFIVMEFVEGETLSARLEKGALPLAESLTYTIQIASALDKAHREGIVHRDLKPGNIMLTARGAKLLDFGLAKVAGPRSSGKGDGPPAGLTSPGMVLGTFQYMSPEQLDGQEADGRTDIFAFGTVLYEMLTGSKAFKGKSQASLIGAIMQADPPPVSRQQPLSPPALDRIVRTCLAKDPDERWQSAADLGRELRWIAEADAGGVTPPLVPPPPRRRLSRTGIAWMTAAAIVLGALVVARAVLIRPAPPPPIARFSFSLPDGWTLASLRANALGNAVATTPVALSHDGRRIAFVAADQSGRQRIWIRALDNLEPQSVPGTDSGSDPFWSPDDQFLGFFAEEKLKKVAIAGGSPIVLSGAPGPQGGSWGSDGTIVFSSADVIQQVSAAGGLPTPIVERRAGEQSLSRPQLLPGGRHVIYHAFRLGEPHSLFVSSLESGVRRPLVMADAMNVGYARGHLLFLQGTSLMAQPFDAARLDVTGAPLPIAAAIRTQPISPTVGVFSASDTGVIVYAGADGANLSELRVFDRAGAVLQTVGKPADFTGLSVSPDGRRLAASLLDGPDALADIWLYDLSSDRRTRLASGMSVQNSFTWAPDGRRIAFGSNRTNPSGLVIRPASGGGTEAIVPLDTMSPTQPGGQPFDWSPDGRFILAFAAGGLWVVPVESKDKPSRWGSAQDSVQTHAQFSPDGRWVAYQSAGRGGSEIYVSSFPEGAGAWQVSLNGGAIPRWRSDGRELFYLAPDGMLMAAAVSVSGSQFEIGTVQPLFRTGRRLLPGRFGSPYDVWADGRVFVVNTMTERSTSSAITVVLNGMP